MRVSYTQQLMTDKPVALEFLIELEFSRNVDFCYCLYNFLKKTYSAPSCDHFGRHGEWKKYLATKILAKVANWRPTD